MSLGDLGDGRYLEEVPEVLEILKASKHQIKFAIGNHDLCMRDCQQFAKCVGIPESVYDFKIGNYRFIVLNPFERSRYSRNEKDKKFFFDYCERNPRLRLQKWPGFMYEKSWDTFENLLDISRGNGEDVIVVSHVPVWRNACLRKEISDEPLARTPEHNRLLKLLDRYPNVRGYFAGHYHGGGIAVRKGVLHKTFRSLCDCDDLTYSIISVDSDSLSIQGFGAEDSCTYYKGCKRKI